MKDDGVIFVPEFKAKIALEAIRDELSVDEISRLYDVPRTYVEDWKRIAVESLVEGLTSTGTSSTDADTLDHLRSKVKRLVTEDHVVAAAAEKLGSRR